MLTAILTNHIWSTRKADALNGLKLMQAEIIGGGTESGKKIIGSWINRGLFDNHTGKALKAMKSFASYRIGNKH